MSVLLKAHPAFMVYLFFFLFCSFWIMGVGVEKFLHLPQFITMQSIMWAGTKVPANLALAIIISFIGSIWFYNIWCG